MSVFPDSEWYRIHGVLQVIKEKGIRTRGQVSAIRSIIEKATKEQKQFLKDQLKPYLTKYGERILFGRSRETEGCFVNGADISEQVNGTSFNPKLRERIEKEREEADKRELERAEYEAEIQKKREQEEAKRDKEIEEAIKETEKIKSEALTILKSGKPYNYFLNTFALDHEGDLTVARAIVLIFAASSVANGEGLHCYVSGSSGRGKSHSAETMFKQLPQEYNWNRKFSDKYLFYAQDSRDSKISEGAALLVDDQTMSETIQELFKIAVSKYHEGVKYSTVQSGKPKDLKLPPRVSWVLLKVDDPGDDQVMNRLIQVRVDESPEKVKDTAKRIQSKYINLKDRSVSAERREILICQEMWREIKKQFVAVEVPCAGYVRFADMENLRNHELFFNLMMSHAVIHFFQRERNGVTSDGKPIIIATKEDYQKAREIFESLYYLGGQAHNTTKTEDQIIKALLKIRPENGIFTIQQIQDETKLNHTTCWKAIHGRPGKTGGEKLGGLLNKCPFIVDGGKRSRYEHESEHESDHRGYTVRHETIRKESYNERIYRVDISGLEMWSGKGTPVSIDPDFEWN